MPELTILSSFFFFNDTATTEIYTLSLHDALPIWARPHLASGTATPDAGVKRGCRVTQLFGHTTSTFHTRVRRRSEEHTSELQSLAYLVCRLLLEKKKHTSRVKICRHHMYNHHRVC